MPYFSPIPLFTKYSIETIDFNAKTIQTLKKRLLTELELSDTPFLTIDELTLSKNDILTLVDNLTDEKIVFFKEIDKDPVLLALLKGKPFRANEKFNNNPIYVDKKFLSFISPYFSEAYSERISAAFIGQHSNIIEALENLPKLYLPEYTEEVYIKLNKTVRQFYFKILALTERLNNYEKANTNEIEQHYCNISIISCINALPEYFDNQRDEFAAAYINLTVPLHNRGNAKFAGEMMVYSINYLECSTIWREDIANRIHKYYDNILNATTSDGNLSLSNVLWLLFLLFQLLRMCS